MNPNDLTAIGWQALVAMMIPPAIQYLKGQPWFPFANLEGTSVNRWFSWFVAAAFGLGIGFKFNAEMGQLVISGLSWSAIQSALLHGGLQVGAHHYIYKGFIAPPLPGIQQAINRAVSLAGVQPFPSFVGDPIGDSATIFSVKSGDPTPIGHTVTSDGFEFVKRSDSVYEKKYPNRASCGI